MKLLLHTCCAPCAIYPLSTPFLSSYEITIFFYNPNIHPLGEYINRRESVVHLASITGLQLMDAPAGYAIEDFFRAVDHKENERCPICYRLRLEKSVVAAKENGYDAFTTTLLYSKYQNHEIIKQICEELSAGYKLAFAYEDFRVGWRTGQDEAKKMGLYRQRYCGCIYSERERFGKTEKRSDG